MEADQEALQYLSRDQLQVADLAQEPRVQEINPFRKISLPGLASPSHMRFLPRRHLVPRPPFAGNLRLVTAVGRQAVHRCRGGVRARRHTTIPVG